MFFQSCDRIFLEDAPSNNLSLNKFCVARTFLVELPLDDVLEVLLVVGIFFTKLADKYHKKTH